MDKEHLSLFLEQHYSKEQILNLREQTYQEVVAIDDILDLCFDENPKVAFRASWLLEHTVTKYPHLLTKQAKSFLQKYPSQQNQSAQRCFSKIAMLMVEQTNFYGLKYEDFEGCLSASFDCLLNEHIPVAIKCNCIDIIYGLADHERWIMDELQVILEKYILTKSPALLSRTKRILKAIKKVKQTRATKTC